MSTNTDSTHLHIGNETQMLMDDILIEEIRGMTRKWHKLERHGNEPLITHDRAWEEAPYFRTGNTVVLRDPKDGLFKCWYEDLGPVRRNVWGRGNYTHRTRMLYAESTDGIHFRKPELDICLFDGKPTNILMGYMDG